ncbi:hypothetical protein BC936DRAFT_141102, partial [Jimgerdemannia flammicorona]
LLQQKKVEVQIHKLHTQSSVQIYKQQSETAAIIGQSLTKEITREVEAAEEAVEQIIRRPTPQDEAQDHVGARPRHTVDISLSTPTNNWEEHESEVEDTSYIVDGVDITAKVKEQKKLENYEFVLSYPHVAPSSGYVYFANFRLAAFYDILDLSERRENGTIKNRFPL